MNLNPLGNRTRRGLRHKQIGRRPLHDAVLALTRGEGAMRHARHALNLGCNASVPEADLSEALGGR